jgi:hypothetical protein
MFRSGLKIAIVSLLALGRPALALDPLPDIYEGPGYISWQVQQDAKLWRMEVLLERLRDPDLKEREKAMRAIGFEKFRVGRNLMMPEIIQPILVETKWLGIERRKHAILSLPLKGKHLWVLVVFRQDSNDEAYWRPYQFLKFDTDPNEGLRTSYPDIMGDQIYFLGLRHVAKNDVYGHRKVQSFFKYDEKQLRLAYQETDNYYRVGQFQGDPQRLEVEHVFKGDQRIIRKVVVKTYPFMPGPEFYNYEENNVKPRKTERFSESFSFNPQNFSFYEPMAELEKLVNHKSALVRREAARRLGENMKTTHPQLEAAMLKDKDAYVRAQCALALENIGDPAALPSLRKALKKYDEPETFEEAFQRAFDGLSKIKDAGAPAKGEAKAKKKPKAQPKPAGAESPDASPAAIPAAEGPKVSEKKK